MKRLKYLLFSLLLFVVLGHTVNAASISVSPSKNLVTVGDTITVTATVSGDDADAWSYELTYSGPVSPQGSTSVVAGSITNGRSATFTFKTTASGTATFGIGSAEVLKFDATDAAVSKGSATVTINQKQTGVVNNNTATKYVDAPRANANASTDATLSRLYIDNYEIEPAFSKDVLEYKLDVANDVESVWIHFATTEDAATVSGAGVRELTEGVNKIDLIVTAPKGNQQTYTIMITRAELDPIIVKLDDKEYKVVRKVEELGELLNGFTPSTITLEEKEVPVFVNEATKVTLVGLKDTEGNVKLYLYEDGKYSEYKVISGVLVSLIPYDAKDKIEGFEKSRYIEIDKVRVEAYYKNDDDKLLLVYGMNVKTGEKNWYIYDTEEGTLLKYYEGFGKVETTSDKRDGTFLIAAFIFATIALACLILAVAILAINRKLREKNDILFRMVESSRKGHWENAVEQSDKDGLSSGKTGVYDPIEETKSMPVEIENENTEEWARRLDSEPEEEIEEPVKKEIEVEEVKEETIANTIVDDITLEREVVRKESNVISKNELSKRELKKLEKEQRRKEKKDMKKAQQEFLDDVDFGGDSAFDTFIREETEAIPVVADYKKKAKKISKANKKKAKKQRKVN